MFFFLIYLNKFNENFTLRKRKDKKLNNLKIFKIMKKTWKKANIKIYKFYYLLIAYLFNTISIENYNKIFRLVFFYIIFLVFYYFIY